MENIRYEVIHAGPGRGWHVVEYWTNGPREWGQANVAGPYTTKAQAEAKAEALRVMADPSTPEPEASKHSYRVRPWVR